MISTDIHHPCGMKLLPVLTLFFLLVLSHETSGQWSTDPSLNTPVAVLPNDQEFPTAVSDGAGGVIVAWSDKRSNQADPDIYAQRLSADGVSMWGANGIPLCVQPGDQVFPVATADGAGGAIVAWADSRNGNFDVYAQRVDANGNVLWTPNGVPVSTATGAQLDVEITSDGNGGAIIVWQDQRNDIGDVFAQRVTATGAIAWATNGIPLCIQPGRQYDPTIDQDGSGGAVFAWTDERTGDADVFAQRVNANGVIQWATNGAAVIVLAESDLVPQIVHDGSGGGIVAWVDWRSTDQQLFAQRIDASGTPVWATNGIYVSDLVGNQLRINMVSDNHGGVVMAFHDDFLGSGINVFAQRVTGDGSLAWGVTPRLVTETLPNQTGLSIVSDGVGGAIVAWADVRNIPGWDVYAQKLDSTGAMQWDSTGKPVATAPNFQAQHVLVSDDRGGAIAVWHDIRNGTDQDIYAQRIAGDGLLPSETSVAVTSGWNLLSLPRVPADSSAQTVFPDAVAGSTFGFASGYVQRDTLSVGEGYWVRFDNSGFTAIGGTMVDSISISVATGNKWVLIGSLSVAVPVSSLVSDPPGAIVPNSIYATYNGSNYTHPQFFEPGKGYWVFVTQPCTLTLSVP